MRSVGGIAQLRDAVGRHPDAAALRGSTTGIGHTRWATHGRVSEGNAHPLTDDDQRVQIVLNGIVENHDELRALLVAEGARFDSDTDAEVVAHLVARTLDRGGLADAVRASLPQLKGHFAFVAATPNEPGTLVGTRRACPLVVGHGRRASASSAPRSWGCRAKLAGAHAIEDDEVVVLDALSARVLDARGRAVSPAQPGARRAAAAPDARAATSRSRSPRSTSSRRRCAARCARRRRGPGLDELPWTQLCAARRMTIVACGTSYHAGLVGRLLLERWAGLRVEVDIASEWRYREPAIAPGRPRAGDHAVGRDGRHDRRAAQWRASAARTCSR